MQIHQPKAGASKATTPPPVDFPERCCSKCGEAWPADEEFFLREKRSPDGWSRMCKACYLELPSVARRRAPTGRISSDWEALFADKPGRGAGHAN